MPIIVEDAAEESSNGQDLRSAMTQTKVAPEEAAKDLERSNLLDTHPDTYVNLKDQLQPEAEAIEKVPSTIQPKTEEYLRQSATHLSLAGEDIDKMNTFERRATYYKEQIIDLPEINRDINEIISKKMNAPEGALEEGDQIALEGLRAKAQQIQATAKNYGIDNQYGEEFGVEVLSAAGDMIRQYTDNLGIFAASVGTGAVIGGVTGSTVPVVGTIAGLTAGAATGAINGSMIVGFLDGYKQTSRSLFNELDTATDDQGKSLNIPHDRKVLISQGAGLISGIAGGLAGKVFASSNSFLKRFIDPKKAAKLVTNPAIAARMDFFGGLAKTALAEGGEEALQEVVTTIGGIFGKMDESEASFINALDEARSSENLMKYVKAGTVGAATGGLVQTVTSAPGYKGLKDRHDAIQQVTEKKKEVLKAQNNMLELAQDMKDAKIAKVAPNEMKNWQKKIFSTLGIDENVYFHLEDLREFANSHEKGEAIRKIVDPKGNLTKMSQELNTPLSVNKSDLMSVIMEFPEITDYMRTTPDGENPLAVRNEAKDFATKLDEAEGKRAAFKEALGAEEATPEQQAQLKNELNATMGDSKYFTSRESYLGQAAIQPIDGIINAKDAADLSTAQLEARLAIDDSLVSTVDARFDKYSEAEFRTETDREIQIETEKLDKEYATINNFAKGSKGSTNILQQHAGVDVGIDNEVTSRHKKKGFSPFAIDPRTLPEDLKAIYLDHPELKKRKAFVEGGIDIEESAILNGYDTGADLLKALAETPTKKQIENRIKNDPHREITKRNQIESSMEDTKLVARDEAFTRLTKAHLKEMDHMVKNNWPTIKRGIIKIARQVPTIESLQQRAKSEIGKMKIRDINPNSFAQGEKRSHKAAVDSFVKGEIEQSFSFKEKAALNNEMRKEAIKIQDRVARNQKFWKKLKDPSIMQELRDAKMSDAMEEYMALYKLDGNLTGEGEQKSFNKFIKEQVAAGNFVPVVPDRLTNTQESFKDLTPEQYQMMTEMGQYMLKQARLKNQILKKHADIEELMTAETIQEEIKEHAEDHYNYDPKRGDRKNENTLTPTDKWANSVRTGISTVSTLKSIIADLDQQKLDGYFHRLLGKPIKEARTAKRIEISEIQAHDEAIINQIYGMDKFKKMFREYVNVPEFKDIPTIGDGEGNIRKVDLMVLQAYMGDPDAKSSIPNFMTRGGIELTIEEAQTVLDTHLDETDAAFVQNFLVDRFKRFEHRSAALHERTTGVAPDMVKGVPVVHKERVLPGGYYPIFRQMKSDEMRAAEFAQDFADKKADLGVVDEGHFFAQMRSAEMTQQGRLKDRTGSKRPLDLSFENVFEATEEAVHDLHFREVGIDSMKILKNPENVKHMKAVVGQKKFGVLLNSVKDTVSKSTERESVLFGDQYRWVNKLIQKAHSLHAVQAIGLNFRSAMVQYDSMSNLVMRTGPSTAKYLAKHASRIAANIAHYDKFVEAAAEINPDIKLEQDNIDNSVVKHSYDFIPADNTFFKNQKVGQKYGMIKDLQKKFIDASFFFVRKADQFNKVLGTHALTEKFLNGDADEYPMSRLNDMSESEKATALRSYIQQAFDLALTASATEDKSALEKNKVASIMVRYWTDRRSRLNTVLAQIDKTKGAIKRKENGQAVQHLLTMSLALGASSAFVAAVRDDDEESPIRQLARAKNAGDYADFAKSELWRFATAPIDMTLDTIPLVDNIKYQAELKGVRSDYRNVSTPLFGVASNISAGIVILKDTLNMALQGKTKKLTDKQRKIILTNAGYIVGGLPTNGLMKTYEALQGGAVRASNAFMKDEIQELHESIDTYINTYKDNKEAQPFIEELKEYKKELPQFDADVKNLIPEGAKEEMKIALSGGKWNAYNKETGAAGIYQFTEARWNEIKNINPDLGLTDNGRVSKSSEQQEKAMDWEIADITRGLLAYEIPVTTENLLNAHKEGFDNFLNRMVASGNGEELDNEYLGDEEIDSAPEKDLPVIASEDIIDFIKNEEKFRAQSYGDQGGKKGVKTIGYGRTTGDLETPTTPEKEEEHLKKRIDLAEQELSKEITRNDLTQNQKNVLIDMHFNLGVKKMKSFIKLVNEGASNDVIQEALKKYTKAVKRDKKGKVVRKDGKPVWVELGGLVKRANKRATMWGTPDEIS